MSRRSARIAPWVRSRFCRSFRNSVNTANGNVSGMPNAGFPKREGDRIVYPKSSPAYFAQFAREAAGIGVRILGGCCGTTPAHIRAMAEAVKSLRPAQAHAAADGDQPPRNPRRPSSNESRRASSGKNCRKRNLSFAWRSIRPKGISLERIYEQVDKVMASQKGGRHRHQQRRDGARGHGRADCRRGSGGPRRRNRAAPHHARSEHHRSAGHAAGRVDGWRCAQRPWQLPAIRLRSAIIRKPAACTKWIPSAW